MVVRYLDNRMEPNIWYFPIVLVADPPNFFPPQHVCLMVEKDIFSSSNLTNLSNFEGTFGSRTLFHNKFEGSSVLGKFRFEGILPYMFEGTFGSRNFSPTSSRAHFP